jgi:hypothetical protein
MPYLSYGLLSGIDSITPIGTKRRDRGKPRVIPKKQGAGKTVLIVDDNAPIRTMVAAAFLSDGFKRCTETEKGKQIAP